jgi:hypothetical protein
LISISQTLLKAKRRISFRVIFYLVKGKAFETGGEISNLKNATCNLIHIPLTICKNKTCGANVVQNVKQKKAIPSYLVRLSIDLIPSNLCTVISIAN